MKNLNVALLVGLFLFGCVEEPEEDEDTFDLCYRLGTPEEAAELGGAAVIFVQCQTEFWGCNIKQTFYRNYPSEAECQEAKYTMVANFEEDGTISAEPPNSDGTGLCMYYDNPRQRMMCSYTSAAGCDGQFFPGASCGDVECQSATVETVLDEQPCWLK